jgi:hypothetical protein
MNVRLVIIFITGRADIEVYDEDLDKKKRRYLGISSWRH